MKTLALTNKIILLMLLVAFRINAQEDYQVFDSDASRMYYQHLYEKFDSLADLRKADVAEAKISAEKQLERRDSLRPIFKDIVGNLPERTPLNPETVDTVDRSDIGFKIEKLKFESLPDHHVTANFYIPVPDTGNFPAVFVMPGHYGNGKAAGVLQSLCMLLAENKIAALIVDPVGQAERGQIISPSTGNLLYPNNSGTTSQTMMDIASILAGKSISIWELWDNKRGLDYLYTRTDMVDTSRIGATGSSGGGAQLLNLLATDYERIDVAAITSWATNKEFIYAGDGSSAGPHHLYYQGINHIDQPEQMLMFAPKPMKIIAGNLDFIDTNGVRQTRDELLDIYQSLGVPERATYFEAPDGHGYSKPKREAAVQWFRTWFYDDDSEVTDPEHAVLPDADLYVSSTGQVTTGFENEKTLPEINAELVDNMAAKRTAFWQDNSKDSCLSMVKKLICFNENYHAPALEVLEEFDRDDHTLSKIKINSVGEIPIPGLMLKSKTTDVADGAVIYLSEDGKGLHAEDNGYFEKHFLDSGKVVLALDLRGIGETKDPFTESKYSNDDLRLGILSMYIGENMIGQRVEEIFKAIDVLSQDEGVDASNISIMAFDRLVPVALHAAALNENIKNVTLLGGYDSWLPIVQDASLKNIMSYAVPRTLEYYDLSDLKKSLLPGTVQYKEPFEARLSRLRVSEGTLSPEFSMSTFDYEVIDVDAGEDEVRIRATLIDKECTLTGDGTYTLSDSDTTINISVTAQDGVTKNVYTVHLPQLTVGIQRLQSGEQAAVSNYPNPFSNETTISYNLESDSKVTLTIYDSSGRMIQKPFAEEQNKGQHDYLFTSGNLAAGVYYYSIHAEGTVKNGPMLKIQK